MRRLREIGRANENPGIVDNDDFGMHRGAFSRSLFKRRWKIEQLRKRPVRRPIMLAKTIAEATDDFAGGGSVSRTAANIQEHLNLEPRLHLHAVRQCLENALPLINGVTGNENRLLRTGKQLTDDDPR